MTSVRLSQVAWLPLGVLVLGTTGCAVGEQRYWPRMPARTESAPAVIADRPSTSSPPNLSGARLHLAPGDTASARALELAGKLQASDKERQTLAARVRQLETALEAKDGALVQAAAEIQEARGEFANLRDEMDQRQRELAGLRARLCDADKENLATLQATVSLLQQMLERDRPAESK